MSLLRFCCLLLLFSLMAHGCTMWTETAVPAGAREPAQRLGRVRITQEDERVVELHDALVAQDTIFGWNVRPSGDPALMDTAQIPLGAIQRIEKSEFDAFSTAVFIASFPATLWLILAATVSG